MFFLNLTTLNMTLTTVEKALIPTAYVSTKDPRPAQNMIIEKPMRREGIPKVVAYETLALNNGERSIERNAPTPIAK